MRRFVRTGLAIAAAAALAAGPVGCGGDASDAGSPAGDAAPSARGSASAAARDGASPARGPTDTTVAGQSAEAPAGESAREDGSPDGAADGPRTTTIHVGGVPVQVEVAEAPEDRRRGLMNRDSLPPDHGMLFVYPEERTLSFWMRNTRIPLDIAYIDQRGFIVDIQQMEPFTEELYESRRPAMYALEMNVGWYEERGIREGDRVRF